MFLFGKKIAKKKVSHFETLSEKWSARHRSLQEKLWEKHERVLSHFKNKTKQFAAGSLAGLMMLASPAASITAQHATPSAHEKPFIDINEASNLLLTLHSYLPQVVAPLTPDQEVKIGEILSNSLHAKVAAELDGIRLNRSYGYIGQEQHLARFPGDTMDIHFTSGEDAQKYYDYGMAPGLGAYGYFAKSANSMTSEQNNREKYYIAVQTFLSPGYLENTKKMNQFFMFHKMLVVNPDNGKAIVADIGDAGPAEWTGKSLGGSPEVMKYLERVDGAQKGPVIYMFIDDPNNNIPLGPVSL
ncbi:MAG TPA: hypothetical protein VLB73_01610 [Patescibacteria group bacterium]|nr:hypothetical protein [Patescibacteria group bacterium]